MHLALRLVFLSLVALALRVILVVDAGIPAAASPPVDKKSTTVSCNASSSMPGRAPSTFFTHGGGPMPLLGQDPKLAEFLASWPASLAEVPAALVIISAHWEEHEVSVASGESPSLIFDYGGFPPESYKYKYDAPGHPALAEKIGALISEAGLGDARMRADRGWDHGVFVPMMLAFPTAKVPIVVVSLVAGYDPAIHWQLGRVLRPLRDEGVAIIGSGSSCEWFATSAVYT
jgi:aromatic ring-opening dioxygenase catalytic subunit (LigB family)